MVSMSEESVWFYILSLLAYARIGYYAVKIYRWKLSYTQGDNINRIFYLFMQGSTLLVE